MTQDNVEQLHEGDVRCLTLLDAILETMHERGKGMSLPAVLGTLELVKMALIADAVEE